MKIAVLALQGDFAAHCKALRDLGAESFPARTARDLERADGLILPGGESTTMLKLLTEEELEEPLTRFAASKPLFGTCAGAILMARETTCPAQRSFNFIDIAVERNAYGRQIDSAIRRLSPEREFVERVGEGEVEAVFIRAPIIRAVGPKATVLLRDGEIPVLVEQGGRLAATFHPELTSDRRVHRLWLEKVRATAA